MDVGSTCDGRGTEVGGETGGRRVTSRRHGPTAHRRFLSLAPSLCPSFCPAFCPAFFPALPPVRSPRRDLVSIGKLFHVAHVIEDLAPLDAWYDRVFAPVRGSWTASSDDANSAWVRSSSSATPSLRRCHRAQSQKRQRCPSAASTPNSAGTGIRLPGSATTSAASAISWSRRTFASTCRRARGQALQCDAALTALQRTAPVGGRHLQPPQGHVHPARVLPTPGRLRGPARPWPVQGSPLRATAGPSAGRPAPTPSASSAWPTSASSCPISSMRRRSTARESAPGDLGEGTSELTGTRTAYVAVGPETVMELAFPPQPDGLAGRELAAHRGGACHAVAFTVGRPGPSAAAP